jgi:hypothetical protein
LAVEKYKDSPEILEKIKGLESKGVVDLINKLMGTVEAPVVEAPMDDIILDGGDN